MNQSASSAQNKPRVRTYISSSNSTLSHYCPDEAPIRRAKRWSFVIITIILVKQNKVSCTATPGMSGAGTSRTPMVKATHELEGKGTARKAKDTPTRPNSTPHNPPFFFSLSLSRSLPPSLTPPPSLSLPPLAHYYNYR